MDVDQLLDKMRQKCRKRKPLNAAEQYIQVNNPPSSDTDAS